MNTVGLKEFREEVGKYEKKIQRGESIVVYRRSTPLFKIVPIDEQWEEVIDFTHLKKGGVNIDELLNRL